MLGHGFDGVVWVREVGRGVGVEREGKEGGALRFEEKGWELRSGSGGQREELAAHVLSLCDWHPEKASCFNGFFFVFLQAQISQRGH